MNHSTKKRWGQNFLIDPNILRKIIHIIQLRPNDNLLEIGPGKGALTKYLLNSGASVHAIEIDPRLCENLKSQFADFSNFHLHQGDALQLDWIPMIKPGQTFRLVGNIPYNITSPLLFKSFENATLIRDIHFLVQKELAQRISAKPGGKDFGILAALTGFYGQAQTVFKVSPSVFRPKPRVTSALIEIQLNPTTATGNFSRQYLKVVKTAFNQRRKTLRNSLVELLPEDLMTHCPVDLSRRPESLSVAELTNLTRWIFQIPA
jgi:16S rRNA (adenine1518-N6/adenine1519-N6)-dimethyltransferase